MSTVLTLTLRRKWIAMTLALLIIGSIGLTLRSRASTSKKTDPHAVGAACSVGRKNTLSTGQR